jgi:hypothetical protein
MDVRLSALLVAFSMVVASAGPASVAAQSASANDGDWVVPRTEHGHPDLQGNWSNATLTPFERRAGQGPTLTPEEVAQLEGGAAELLEQATLPSDPNRPAPPVGGDSFGQSAAFQAAGGGTGGYDGVYIDLGESVARVNGEARSSLVTFPENGRVPPVTEAARQWQQEQRALTAGLGRFDHPELLSLGDRCIMSFGSNAGPPMIPNGFYNNNYTIVQNADHVLIMAEMVHDTRIIRLGDGPRLPSHVRPYMGDSWGHWEGETLVVETTNFHPDQRFRGQSSDNLKVIERFTRVGEGVILYEFTVDDPTVYTETWGGQIPMNRMHDLVYEYACHEGNYAMESILSGARFQERQASQQDGDSR